MHQDLWAAQARRWAKFPATLLFALSVIWLVRSLFGLDPGALGSGTKTGIGALVAVYVLGIIPLGSAVCGIGLLFLQAWAYVPAALLPLWPVIAVSADKVARIDRKFAQFHQDGQIASLGNGLIDVLVVGAIWTAYAIALFYLWKSWRMRPAPWRPGRAAAEGAGAGSAPGTAGAAEEGEVCLLLPEVDEGPDS